MKVIYVYLKPKNVKTAVFYWDSKFAKRKYT